MSTADSTEPTKLHVATTIDLGRMDGGIAEPCQPDNLLRGLGPLVAARVGIGSGTRVIIFGGTCFHAQQNRTAPRLTNITLYLIHSYFLRQRHSCDNRK